MMLICLRSACEVTWSARVPIKTMGAPGACSRIELSQKRKYSLTSLACSKTSAILNTTG